MFKICFLSCLYFVLLRENFLALATRVLKRLLCCHVIVGHFSDDNNNGKNIKKKTFVVEKSLQFFRRQNVEKLFDNGEKKKNNVKRSFAWCEQFFH